MNDCFKFEEYCSLYVDGELTEEQAKELVAHLKQCKVCTKYIKDLKAIKDETQKLQKEIPSTLHESIMSAVEKDIEMRTVQYKHSKRRVPVFTLTAAAAAAVILSLNGSLAGVINTFQGVDSAATDTPLATANNRSTLDATNPTVNITLQEEAYTLQNDYYSDTSNIIDIPNNIASNNYAYYVVAVGTGDIPSINGDLLMDDTKNSTSFFQLKNDMTLLEKTIDSLESSDYVCYMSQDTRISLSAKAEKGLLVVIKE